MVSSQPSFHEAIFYEEDSGLLDTTARWLHSELVEGCGIIVIAPQAHRLGLGSRLSVLGTEYANAVRQGRVAMLSAEKCLDRILLQGVPRRDEFNAVLEEALGAVKFNTAQCENVAAYGGMVGMLCERGAAEAAVQLEEYWNEALLRYPIKLRCGYSVGGLRHAGGRACLLPICQNHTHVTADMAEHARFGWEHDEVVSYLQKRIA